MSAKVSADRQQAAGIGAQRNRKRPGQGSVAFRRPAGRPLLRIGHRGQGNHRFQLDAFNEVKGIQKFIFGDDLRSIEKRRYAAELGMEKREPAKTRIGMR